MEARGSSRISPLASLSNLAAALGALALALALAAAAPARAGGHYRPRTVHDVDLLPGGNLLVTDGGTPSEPGSGGIFEIDREGRVVWSLRDGLDWAHNADRQPDGTTLVSDTGNDRVILAAADGTILWSSDDVSLSDGTRLDYPNDANLLASGHVLITDRNHHRVIEIEPDGTVVWQFGETGVPGNGPSHLASPHNADRLPGGNTIIADSQNDRIVEVSPAGAIVWSYDGGGGGLDFPRDADRLRNGHTLINDTNHRRILEITPGGVVTWSRATPDTCYDADRLASGNTLFGSGSDILEVNPAGAVVWSYPPFYATETLEGYFVVAGLGARIWTKIIQPRADLYPDERFPAVVGVPGGLGAGETSDLLLARRGFVEVEFNAEGRGLLHPSDGAEDYNGYRHQEDLAAVIRFTVSRSNVLRDNLGVFSSSYGITMASGCLARHPELPVKYLIDTEGPSESFVTCFEPWALDDEPINDRHETAYEIFGHWSECRDPSPENAAFWRQREATRFIGRIRCRYLRIQAEWDHAQPPNQSWPGFDFWPCDDPCACWYPGKHGTDLVNLATLGTSPWTRMNGSDLGNPPNRLYSGDDRPVLYPGRFDRAEDEWIVREMADMPPLGTSAFER